MGTNSAMKIEVVDERGFSGMREEWDSVLAASRQNGPFLTHAWADAWWRTYGEGTMAVATCRRSGTGRLLGVLPTFTSRRGKVLTARTARFLGDKDVGSTGLGPFALAPVEGEVLSAFAEWARGGGPGWDVLDFRFMDPAHRFVERLEAVQRSRAYPGVAVCPRIPLPDEWERYLSGLSKHMRHEVRRSRRRVEERGWTIEVVTDPAALPEAIEDFLTLFQGRMRHRLDPDFVVTERYREFVSCVTPRLLAQGRLRLTFLRSPERRLAVLYLMRHGDTMYAVQSAFDDDEARQDAGRALWGHAIEGAIVEGCTSLDMLLGDQPYKQTWGATDVRTLSELHLYRVSLAAEARRARDVVAAWRARSAPAAAVPQAARPEPVAPPSAPAETPGDAAIDTVTDLEA
jgi:CelD/BcsL family acetyltransferase involved in cellulose biosynthesis